MLDSVKLLQPRLDSVKLLADVGLSMPWQLMSRTSQLLLYQSAEGIQWDVVVLDIESLQLELLPDIQLQLRYALPEPIQGGLFNPGLNSPVNVVGILAHIDGPAWLSNQHSQVFHLVLFVFLLDLMAGK
jgi:hypothetical protein